MMTTNCHKIRNNYLKTEKEAKGMGERGNTKCNRADPLEIVSSGDFRVVIYWEKAANAPWPKPVSFPGMENDA